MVTLLVKSAPPQEPSPIYRRALTPAVGRGSDNVMWVQRPASLQVGDMMLALVLANDDSVVGISFGWAALQKVQSGTGVDTTVLYRVATAWDLVQTQWGFYVPRGLNGHVARVVAYAGAVTAGPRWGGFATSTTTTTAGNAPSVTTTEKGEMYVAFASAWTSQDFKWPASMSGSSAQAEYLEFTDEPRPVAGETFRRAVSVPLAAYLAVGSVSLLPQRIVPLEALLSGEGSLSGRMNRGVTNMPMRASLAGEGSLTGNMATSPRDALPPPIAEVLVPRKTTPRRESDLLITEEAPPPVGRSWAFEYWGEREGFVREGGRGALETREIATLRQWIEKCVNTERGVHPIHPPDYGLRGLNEVIGAPPSSLALGTLAERVRQALIFHPRISDIENFRYSFDPDDDLLEVSFRVLLDGDESVDVEQLTLS
jgi:hypothetical protein